jgi:hypothetical protein
MDLGGTFPLLPYNIYFTITGLQDFVHFLVFCKNIFQKMDLFLSLGEKLGGVFTHLGLLECNNNHGNYS